jgi:hypothetical protein
MLLCVCVWYTPQCLPAVVSIMVFSVERQRKPALCLRCLAAHPTSPVWCSVFTFVLATSLASLPHAKLHKALALRWRAGAHACKLGRFLHHELHNRSIGSSSCVTTPAPHPPHRTHSQLHHVPKKHACCTHAEPHKMMPAAATVWWHHLFCQGNPKCRHQLVCCQSHCLQAQRCTANDSPPCTHLPPTNTHSAAAKGKSGSKGTEPLLCGSYMHTLCSGRQDTQTKTTQQPACLSQQRATPPS